MRKKVPLVIGGICILFICLLLIAPFFISTDVYKEQIETRVSTLTGRTLSIDGPLVINLFPTARLVAHKVRLSNPPGFPEDSAFVTVDTLELEVALMPLLQKELVIKDFLLDEPVISMAVSSEGAKNWMFNDQRVEPAGGEAPAKDPKALEGVDRTVPPVHAKRPVMANSKPLPGKVVLSNFALKKGTVRYVGPSGMLEVKNLNANVVVQSFADAAMIDASGEWRGKTITLKAGVGTLQTLLEEQKMDVNASVKSDIFDISIEGNYDKNFLNAKQSIRISSLKDLKEWLSPGKPLATPAKLAFKTNGDVRCGLNYCNFTNLSLTLDDLQAKGSIKASSLIEPPQIDIGITTDMLDLTPFLPNTNEAAQNNGLVPDAQAAEGRWSDQPFDLAPMHQLTSTVEVHADTLKVRKLEMGNAHLLAKLHQSTLTAELTSSALYRGTANVSLNVSSIVTPPTADAHVTFQHVDVGPLLVALDNYDKLTGRADVQFDLASICYSEESLVSELMGRGQFKLNDGMLRQVNIGDMMHNIGGAFDNTASANQNTPITQLSGTFNAQNGIITNQDLVLQLKDITAKGEGSINLPQYSISYRLMPQLVRQTKDASTGQLTTKEGLVVPVLVSGSLDNPKFHPDLNSAVQNALQEDPKKLKEQLKNSKDILKEQLKNPQEAVKNIKGLLKGLTGGQ